MLSEDVSAVLLNPLSQKMKDPSALLISYVIGGITFDRALLDLGASVNLLPVMIQVVCPRPRGPRLRPRSIIHEGFMEALGLVGP